MSSFLRFTFVSVILLTVIAADVRATGLRLFGGRMLPFRQRCEPMIVECVPLVKPIETIPEPKPSRMLHPFPTLDKDLKVNVKSLAQLLKNDQKEDARKFAIMVARTIEEIADLEQLYRPRSKGALGWGNVFGPNPANDGLGSGIVHLLNRKPANGAKNPDNVEAAYWIAAMGELILAKGPLKDALGGKTKKAWIAEGQSLREGGLQLAKAFEKDVNLVHPAAAKINSACISCHSKFKE
jgi:hypothetical protein